jgi:hypothetical protein
MLIGLALVGSAFVAPPPVNGLMILAVAGPLLAATHGRAHWAVGRAIGIQFTELFIARPSRPQPGIKIDYGTYLRVPRARAWMHASGALVTKIIPFALIPVAFAARTPRWVLIVLALLGLGPDRDGRALLDEDVGLEAVQSGDAERPHRMKPCGRIADPVWGPQDSP